VNHRPRRKRAITETKGMIANKLKYSAPDRRAEYCDERVCLSVCLSVRDIFGTRRPSFTKFFVHAIYGCGSVLLWRRNGNTSGFVDDVMLAHKPMLLDVAAAQLKRSAHAALGLAINCAQ